METKSLKVTLERSRIGRLPKQIRNLDALGLRKIGASRTFPDNANTRGMLGVVAHMVRIEEAK